MARGWRRFAQSLSFVVVVALLASPSGATLAQTDETLYVSNHGKGANLLPTPGASDEVVKPSSVVFLPDGTQLRQTGADQTESDTVWKPVEVTLDGKTYRGWLRADLTSRTRPAATNGTAAGTPSPPVPVITVSAEDARRVILDAVSQGRIPASLANITLNGGSARVIVELRLATPFRIEPRLAGAQAVQTQRTAIQRAQSNILANIRGPHGADAKLPTIVPYMGLEVDAIELATLLLSPDVVSITEELPERPDSSIIHDDPTMRPSLAQSVPLIGAPSVWAAGYTGAGQTIAIIDTGVDKAHSFLTGKVVSEACYSSGSSSDQAVPVCPGGVSASTATGSGVFCPLTVAGCYHGTHVAGIAAGKGSSFSGVAKDASLIAIQVFSQVNSSTACSPGVPPCALTYPMDQVMALNRVYDLRATYAIPSANMSLGGGKFTSQAACDTNSSNTSRKLAIDTLRAAGIATTIASGNNSYSDGISTPACISSAISVGNTLKSDTVNSGSNSASFLSLLAPGTSIYSSLPNNQFNYLTGTSMAAPHVAGAWALLRNKAPGATVDQILTALTTTGLLITDPRNNITKPRIRVDVAANSLVIIGIPNDNFAQAVAITSFPSSFSVQSTANATVENGETTSVTCGGTTTFGLGKTVWYRYTAPVSGTIQISTAGSDYDTTIVAWRNASLGNFPFGYCNDDFGGLTSQITFPVVAGEVYSIQIGGYFSPSTSTPANAASGHLQVSANALATLSVSFGGAGSITSSPAGISCLSDCSEDFPLGTIVTLTASPGAGFGFDRWTAGCASVSPACQLQVNGNTSAFASFVNCAPRPLVHLNVVKNGDGRIRITITPGAGLLKSVGIQPSRGTVDVVGGPSQFSGTFTPAGGSPQLVLLLSRTGSSGGAVTGLTIADACGSWPTFAGAGADPRNWTP